MAKWQLDPAHSAAEFSARHMMVTNVRGGFNDLSGTIVFDPENAAASSVEAVIQVASINTGAGDRDNHLRSPDFFDAEKYPTITFTSTNVEITSDETARVTGNLTIKDVTKPVMLDVTFLGKGDSPFGDVRAGFEASTKINREDWGLTWNQALESGGWLVGKEVKLSIDAQGILVAEGETA